MNDAMGEMTSMMFMNEHRQHRSDMFPRSAIYIAKLCERDHVITFQIPLAGLASVAELKPSVRRLIHRIVCIGRSAKQRGGRQDLAQHAVPARNACRSDKDNVAGLDPKLIAQRER